MKKFVAVAVLLCACIAFAAETKSTEWPTYGHDAGGMRFSPLKQITPANVARLQPAWVYHMKRTDNVPFAGSSSTPLVIKGVMYAATPYGRIVALDPMTGNEIWVYALPNGQPSTRGIEYWSGDARTPAQIVFGNRDGSLFSINAATGKPNEAFGDKGIVNLNTPEILQGLAGRDGLGSPPTMYKNLIITGGLTQENPAKGPAGDVRAWDIHTGKLVWTFHSVPREGEKFNDTWEGDSWKNRSGVNVWGFLTVDMDRGIVYMPFGAPSNDRYGGDRPGNNLFSSSIVAADANTGKYLWHFQLVHHDIWDYDMQSPPALINVKLNGRIIPAVAVTNKSGLLFLLDRVTGKPIYGVEERPVVNSDVPLERASATQPFPLKPPPLARMTMTMEDIANVTPELEAACRKLVVENNMQLGGPYLPVTYNRLRVGFPGPQGGPNWGGASFNPDLGYLFINTSDLGQMQGFRNRADDNRDNPYEAVPGGGRFKDTATNMMCQQPPWGMLTAVNVNTGEFAWRINFGVTDRLPSGKQKTGRPSSGGSIATASGLVFIGATDDNRFRAFDAKTGKELWTVKLGAAAYATPISYLGKNGKQYVVITSAAGGFLDSPLTDDSINAFTLP